MCFTSKDFKRMRIFWAATEAYGNEPKRKEEFRRSARRVRFFRKKTSFETHRRTGRGE
jgi:hypothetical protein